MCPLMTRTWSHLSVRGSTPPPDAASSTSFGSASGTRHRAAVQSADVVHSMAPLGDIQHLRMYREWASKVHSRFRCPRPGLMNALPPAWALGSVTAMEELGTSPRMASVVAGDATATSV